MDSAHSGSPQTRALRAVGTLPPFPEPPSCMGVATRHCLKLFLLGPPVFPVKWSITGKAEHTRGVLETAAEARDPLISCPLLHVLPSGAFERHRYSLGLQQSRTLRGSKSALDRAAPRRPQPGSPPRSLCDVVGELAPGSPGGSCPKALTQPGTACRDISALKEPTAVFSKLLQMTSA